MIDWSSLQVLETLNIDWHTKHIALLVNIRSDAHPNGATSVLLANRHGLDSASDLVAMLTPSRTCNRHLELLAHNDIYHQYLLKVDDSVDSKLQLIHAATPAHIAKYRRQERYFVAETPALHTSIVRPYIEQQSGHRIRWVDNILEGISEQGQVIVRREGVDGFVILPDSKWDQKSLNSLYLLVLVNRRDLRSIRDLNQDHLPLLKSIQEAIVTEVAPKFSIDSKQLRVYIHYMPTYFYFHIHIVHVDYESPGCAVGAAHLLNDIIDNIMNISGDYYQRRTLYYTLGSEHELYQQLRDHL